MRREEAVVLVLSNYPEYTIGKVTETDEYFLVSIFPRQSIPSDCIRPVLCDDGLKAVNKKSKEVFTYNPILHGIRNN